MSRSAARPDHQGAVEAGVRKVCISADTARNRSKMVPIASSVGRFDSGTSHSPLGLICVVGLSHLN
jgi:hypothetical protein